MIKNFPTKIRDGCKIVTGNTEPMEKLNVGQSDLQTKP